MRGVRRWLWVRTAGRWRGVLQVPGVDRCARGCDLLFVGVNPRRSSTNIDLATAAMSSGEAFRVLSTNREPGGGGRAGMRNIRPRVPETSTLAGPPLRGDVEIVEAVWGRGTHFEERAAVTRAGSLLHPEHGSRGAAAPLGQPGAKVVARAVANVRPTVISAAGAPPRDYLEKSKNDATNPFCVRIPLRRCRWGRPGRGVGVRGPPSRELAGRSRHRRGVAHATAGIRRVVIECRTPVFQGPIRRRLDRKRPPPRVTAASDTIDPVSCVPSWRPGPSWGH